VIPRGIIPLPEGLTAAEIDAMWAPWMTARGSLWIKALNPLALRSRFAPGLYLKLLGAPSSSADNGSSTADPSTGDGGASGGSEVATAAPPPPSSLELAIRKDLARTFPGHPLFCSRYGLSVLFNALKAFATFDPAIGYSQGLAFIAGLLMLHMGPPAEHQARAFAQRSLAAAGVALQGTGPVILNGANDPVSPLSPASALDRDGTPTSPDNSRLGGGGWGGAVSFASCSGEGEEVLFWSLVHLMQSRKHNLRSLYGDDCAGLRLILSVLSASLDALDPELARHLHEQGCEVSLYATSWFVATFAHRFSLPFASAVWDYFVNVGLVFFVQVGVMVLRHLRSALLTKPFDQLVPFLSSTALPLLPDSLPDQAFAEVEIPNNLVQQLQPNETRSTSFKSSRR
jgi:hypothetical protein